jgi:hypothetical protein
MTFAGFFVHLDAIPPVLRWLQWLCPLKYCLEALAVNEVGSGLMIQDTLEGVPVNVSASLIMNLVGFFRLIVIESNLWPSSLASDQTITIATFWSYSHLSQGLGLV